MFSCGQESTNGGQESAKVYTDAEIAAESKKVNDFFQKSFDIGVDNYPEFETKLGIKTHYGDLNDNSPAAAERDLKISKEELAWIKDSVNVEALSKNTLLSYKLFKQGVWSKRTRFQLGMELCPNEKRVL